MKNKLLIFLCLLASGAFAQNTASKPAAPLNYGNPISLETARKAAAAAEAYALKNQWSVVIAVVDTGGNLVLLERLDNTQIGSIEVAIAKATTSNNFKRSTKVFEEAVAGGGIGNRVLSLPGDTSTIEGGEVIVIDGKIVGAIGVSGVQANQDGEVARAGVGGVK